MEEGGGNSPLLKACVPSRLYLSQGYLCLPVPKTQWYIVCPSQTSTTCLSHAGATIP